MRRRDLLKAILGGLVGWSSIGRAQNTGGVRHLAVLILNPEGDPQGKKRVDVLEQELTRLGWSIGNNLRIDYRWGAFDPQHAREGITELLSLNPDVILTNSVVATQAAKKATQTIPIVFNGVSAPVELGFVANLSHPGGNITGFTNLEPSVGTKWLELVKEVSPDIKRVQLLFNPDSTPAAQLFYQSIEQAAAKFSVMPAMAPVHDPSEIEPLFKIAEGGGIIVQPDTFLASNRKLIIESAARHRVPVIYPFSYYAADGGLISYGPDLIDQFRRSAAYITRILNGEQASDLPVQQPTKFELVINLKTAKTLGLGIPQTLLATADEVIE